ncbi:exodeoxyribonuclease VII small subunit [soil metagenome]
MSGYAEAPVGASTFQAALGELERVVAALEKGDVPLEASIALYARGAELRRHCEAKLKSAEEQVALITEGPDGEVRAKPVDIR